MKRFIVIVGSILLVLFLASTVGIYIWTGQEVRKNIKIAKSKYPGGIAEDALIDFLLDTLNSPQQRSDIAVWTLGQIRSEKAVPVLRKLYKHDPEGTTCYGRHESVLCQREIYKALNAREVNWWPLHPGLNK
jgi:hypothetical protein